MSSVGGAGIGLGLHGIVSNPAQALAEPEDAKQKVHHLKNGKGFQNPWDSFEDTTPLGFFKMTMWRKFTGQQNVPDTTPPTIPILAPTFLPTRSTPSLRATWLGHACYFVEFPSGLRVLFDPVFEDCCAPINAKSLKRYTPPPCEVEDLPVVDLVVISHNHYDHLSYPTTMRIAKKWPEATFFVPLRNRKWFESIGVDKERVVELDWWEGRDVKLVGSEKESAKGKEVVLEATISALPCQHVSARTPFDKNRTLWASWSVESGGKKVWFAGDTGYRKVPYIDPSIDDYGPEYSHLPHCSGFSQIGLHRGPFHLGLIPIGAYAPRHIFSATHASPSDAVNIFLDTKCQHALAMHWGTWVLTEEDVMEPKRKLEEAVEWKKGELNGRRFETLSIGGTWKEGEDGE